jgi:hemerythrin-like domain-containing protein
MESYKPLSTAGRPILTGVVHTLQHAFRPEEHTLDEVRDSLDEVEFGNTDLIRLFEKHHDFIEESAHVLTNTEASEQDRRHHTLRLLSLLEMHGMAEEETLYCALREADSKLARVEGIAGQAEHDLAFQLQDELLDAGADVIWNETIEAKAKVLAAAMLHHIREEEYLMFPVARKVLGEAALNHLTEEYVEKCKAYLDRSTEEGANSQSLAQ